MGDGHRIEKLSPQGQQVEKEKKQGLPISPFKGMLY